MNSRKWLRKRIRIPEFDYASPGCYFVTICAKDRQVIFWKNVAADTIRQDQKELSETGKIVDMAIGQIPEFYPHVSVDKYCIMPDHIHMIIRIHADENGQTVSEKTVGTIVGQMKRWVSKQIGRPIWQKSFVDRVIRDERGYLAVWEYIDQNPIKLDFADDNIDFSSM